VGLAVWLVALLSGQTNLERRLYDLQFLVANNIKGDPPLHNSLVAGAIDRKAFGEGFRDTDLRYIVDQFPGTAVDITTQDCAPFLQADEDGLLRSVRLYIKEGEKITLAPPLETFLRFKGLTLDSVQIESSGVRAGDLFIETDHQGRYFPYLPLANQMGPSFMVFSADTLKNLLHSENVDNVVFRDRLRPVSLVHLLQGEVDLSDRLVLLGVFLNEARSEEFDTLSGHMVRLEIYTSLVNSLLKQDYLRPLGAVWGVTLSILFVLLLSLLLRGRQTLNSSGWWLVWTALWLGVNQLLFYNNTFTKQSPVLTAGAVMLLVHLLRRSWRVRTLLQSLGGTAPLEKTGDEMEATIMFTNLPDMVKELEDSNPQKAQEARVAHSRCVGYLVNQYSGRLVDLQGDAQMLAFGLEGVGDHRQQAVSCGLEIVTQVNALLGTDENSAYCGIVTGPVAVGRVGGGQYHGVAAIGDTTNSAARLMGQAKKRGIPVLGSHETVEPLGLRAEVEKVGEISVKGREKPLEAWQIKSFNSPPMPTSVTTAGSFRLPLLVFLTALLVEAVMIVFLNQTLPLEKRLLDTLTTSSKSSPMLFAGLDEQSLQAKPWPWPRSLHADIARNCLDAGAAAVFLDFLFEDPSTPTEDRKLIEFVQTEDRVLVAAASISNNLHQPQPPPLLPDILDSGRWGLINHSPQNEGNRMRFGLWEMTLIDDANPKGSIYESAPGVARKIVEIVAPEKLARLDGRLDFLIRWGPQPEEVSYHRLLNPDDPIFDTMKGRIVFAGANLEGSADEFETPVGRLKGAVIHALSVQTLLNDELIEEVQDSSFSFLLAFLYGSVLLYLSWQAEGAGSQIALLAGGLIVGTMFIKFVSTGMGYYLGTKMLIAVPVAILLARIVAVIDANRAVGQYIPRQLQQKLERDGTVADASTLATVLLTDIRGYTGLSEGRSPSEILELLNSYHEKTARIYEQHGGHLLTYQGDAQIIVFGPLQKVKNPVVHAVRAAQGIPAVLETVAKEAGMAPEDLRVGSGITTGPVTLSLLGIAGQLQYSVFGSPVRRAHHLQSLSDSVEDSIILDERSRFAVKDTLELTEHNVEGETFYTVPEQQGPGLSL
jgi:adenylate cyclase